MSQHLQGLVHPKNAMPDLKFVNGRSELTWDQYKVNSI